MADFVTADTHFGHKNALAYYSRPFKNLEKMNEELVLRWNSVVDVEDTVYHLGDFATTKDQDTWRNLLWRLNGRKILFLGHHDPDDWSVDCYKELGFSEVYSESLEFEQAILSHRPLQPELLPKPNWHGHTHGKTHPTLSPPKSICFCVELNGYAPVRLPQPLGEPIAVASYPPLSDWITW